MSNIAAAFVKAKRAFGPALKDCTNPAFKSKYADLGACLDAVDGALLANGIALMQETFEDSTGVTVETVFLHESGETLRGGKLHVPASKQDPQGYGSALTYARRYSLQAACGIAPEDDDGNAASKQLKRQNDPVTTVIKSTDGAGASLSADKRAELDELALHLIDCHLAGKDLDAIRLYYDPKTFSENEDRVYVWGLLGAQSKLRAAIKANNPNLTVKPADGAK